jgi:hypothetical protein
MGTHLEILTKVLLLVKDSSIDNKISVLEKQASIEH